MKILRLSILLFLAGFGCLHAQTSITLTFTATLNGDHQPLDSILIENLTQGGDTTLYGNDTVLVLHQSIGTEHPLQPPSGELVLYPSSPNPFHSSTSFEFYLPQQDWVRIMVSDLSGREVVRFSEPLQPGNHQMEFHSGQETCYLLSVKTAQHRKVQKLITPGRHNGTGRLEYKGWMGGAADMKLGKGVLPWSPGDSLKFTGYISNQLNERFILTTQDNPSQSSTYSFAYYLNIPCPGMPTMTDYNGNIYNTVQIGNQCWMKENLKVRNYKNGTIIPNITDSSGWGGLSTGARCWYNNDSATYAATYGALYNCQAVGDANGLCPTDWHVPTDLEWQTLEMFLGMSESQASSYGLCGTDEGGKMKEAGLAHWNSPNTGATNSSGFTALPGGIRYYNGNFNTVGNLGWWWSSSAGYSSAYAWLRQLTCSKSVVYRFSDIKNYGQSVRCVRD